MRTASLYIRKSTTEKQANSLNVQIENMREYCSGHFELDNIFSDQQTGKTLDRPGLQNAFAWLAEDQDRVLIFYKVDRYARTMDQFQEIRSFINHDQIRFMDLQQPQDRCDMLMIQLRLMIGENESRLIGNRISQTIKHLQSKGVNWGGDAEHMENMRESSAVVRRANANEFALKTLKVCNVFLDNGHMNQTQLVENLNTIGFTTRTGKDWTRSGLARVLIRAKKLKGA